MNKFEQVRDILRPLAATGSAGASVLDIGCRGCELKAWLGDSYRYTGVDLVQNSQGTVAHVLDVSQGLPFGAGEFDAVVALDVVEHLDDFDGALRELLRVSKRQLVVMLPNMAYVSHRLRFLATGRVGEKYDLNRGHGKDRHRWLTTAAQADAYMASFACEHQLAYECRWFNDSLKKRAFAHSCSALGIGPNLWAWASLHVLTRK